MISVTCATSLSPREHEEWDGFVLSKPIATVCHLTGYGRALEKALGTTPFYFRFYDGGELVGVWPACERGYLWNRHLTSMPLFETGAPIFNEGIAGDELSRCLSEVCSYARARGLAWIECRAALGMGSPAAEKLFSSSFVSEYATLRLERPDVLFRKAAYQVRKNLARAQGGGLVGVERDDEAGIETLFYPLYIRYMKYRHGTPPLPKLLFLEWSRELSQYIKVFYVLQGNAVAAAVLGFAVGRRIYISHAPSDLSLSHLRPSDLAHWRFIEWSASNGYEFFDFGSARYPGQKEFKAKWGCTFSSYNRMYLTCSEGEVGHAVLRPEHPLARLTRGAWRCLMPVSLSPYVGKIAYRVLNA